MPRERLALSCGVAGPALFTASWVGASWLQHGKGGYTVVREHISGLGAPDALAPWVVNGGFVALGGCTLLFAAELEAILRPAGSRRLGGRARVALETLRLGGASAAALGLLRRDRMLLAPVGGPSGPSWRNRSHDALSAVGYGCLLVAPLLLGAQHPRLPGHASAVYAVTTSAATGGLLVLFASRRLEPYNGIVQRLAVTLPLWWMSVLALGLLRRTGERGRPEERRT